MINQILCQGIDDLQNQVPLGNSLALRAKMGVYDKEPLSYNGHSDTNISELIKNPKWSCYSYFISL